MAITGTGTEQDPFIVHDYDEFMATRSMINLDNVYIQFFENERPNQTIDCNNYGSEFKWHQYEAIYGRFMTLHINLNGCTIKNFLIADGETMFLGEYTQYRQSIAFYISNGSFRNVFLGSATSKFCTNYVHFQDVSISFNFAGTTVTPFNGTGDVTFDNCALYLVGSTLQAKVFTSCSLSDTDIELHISNLNETAVFAGASDGANDRTILTDCRLQGKVSGASKRFVNGIGGVLGCTENYYGSSDKMNLINCVVDIDISGVTGEYYNGLFILFAYSSGYNTTVYCKDHYPTGVTPPSDWNYMSHENIRNGTYLNNAGFTVVEVAGG